MASSLRSNFSQDSCVICRVSFSSSTDTDVSEVGRGLERLLQFSENFGDVELAQYLQTRPAIVRVHNRCRRNYTSKRRFDDKRSNDSAEPESSCIQAKSLRSTVPSFRWKNDCFLCGEMCITCAEKRPQDEKKTRKVETLEIRENILKQCVVRADTWGLEVQGRLMTCCDLVAEEAVYHKNCHSNFFKIVTYGKSGRPVNAAKAETFEKLCEWLEVNDFEMLTLQDVVDKARVIVPDNDYVYSEKWLKQKLVERYGVHIQFSEVRGRRNVICWKEMAAYIVNKQWHEQQKEKDIEHIVITAAKLLKTAIRETPYKMDSYPVCADVQNPQHVMEWMPDLLQVFMDHLMSNEVKKTAIGHSIVQAVRPRSVVAPIPFALGITVDHMCASKYLLNILYRLGMSISYDEVLRFKQSVTRCETLDKPQAFPNFFTQFSADNVDHDVCTLDGSGTLHAMGIISISSCNNEATQCRTLELPVPRLKLMRASDVSKLKRIPLKQCILPSESMLGIAFQNSLDVCQPVALLASTNLDLLWHIGWFFEGSEVKRPSWAGFNDSLVRNRPAQGSDIRILPIIDLNPNNASCIYSTLVFIANESQKLCIKTPTVTFDQPLWLKAVNIVTSHKLNIVCRLGVFHTQMSFLGSLGTLMAGSGLMEAMECCYGPNTVKHICSGKAVARAVRAHFLVESALTIMLLKSVLSPSSAEMNEIQEFYTDVTANGYESERDEFPESFVNIEFALADFKRGIAQQSRTGKLWLQYLQYVSTLKLMLRAERCGDWQLHIWSISQMINLFAATGHNNYAKCARLYCEMMTDLPRKHSELYEQFMAGAHVARRSNKFWAGISTDLAIEQAMMRAVKGRGGLTHGRGVTESVRNTWVSTVHKTSSVKTALAQYTNLEYCHDTAQHSEMGKSRVIRDNKDLLKVLQFFEQHNPFDVSDNRLRGLVSGIAAADSDNINCDEVEQVGAVIMTRINGVPFKDVKLKRSDQVKTLAHVTNAVTAGGKKPLNIDPAILFNRFLVIMQRAPDMKPYFAYELSELPSSMFTNNTMRKTNKAQLGKEMCRNVESSNVNNAMDAVSVIDGGYLLHVVHWNDGYTYADVAGQYIMYVDRHYGRSSVIVFDGYGNGPSTKDQEHQRRTHKKAPNIILDANNIAFKDQGSFLCNDKNKCSFVALLVMRFRAAGYIVHQATDDADTLVVKVALELASTNQGLIAVIANDTDILVMLVAHYKHNMSDIIMYSHIGKHKSIRAISSALGDSIVRRLLLIHAISGSDTTSCLFGHGKVSVFHKLSKATDIEPLVNILESPTSCPDEVMTAGCGLLALMYGGRIHDQLNHLRYSMYMHATATSTQLPRLERLPPTENAARFHIYRVHLQTVHWRSLSTTDMDPQEWGWRLHEGRYIPIANDKNIAPPDIMKVVCCKCSTEARKPCGGKTCLCQKYGLTCISACKNCNGSSCENAGDIHMDNTGDEDDDMMYEDADDENQQTVSIDHEETVRDDDIDYYIEDETDYYVPWRVDREEEL